VEGGPGKRPPPRTSTNGSHRAPDPITDSVMTRKSRRTPCQLAAGVARHQRSGANRSPRVKHQASLNYSPCAPAAVREGSCYGGGVVSCIAAAREPAVKSKRREVRRQCAQPPPRRPMRQSPTAVASMSAGVASPTRTDRVGGSTANGKSRMIITRRHRTPV